MQPLRRLLQNNEQWAARVEAEDPEFFLNLSKQQAPKYLWIGCSDSRVPANQIVGLLPGGIFVHRNVANLVVHTDFNCLSVIQFAVEVLNVEHIIVCGHYGCGGVQAASVDRQLGLIDNWLRHVRNVYTKNKVALGEIESEQERVNRLCELNVMEQVNNVCNTTIVQRAWSSGIELSVHGWIYSLENGRIKDLQVTVDRLEGSGSES